MRDDRTPCRPLRARRLAPRSARAALLASTLAALSLAAPAGARFDVDVSKRSGKHARVVLAARKGVGTSTMHVLFRVGSYDDKHLPGLTRLTQHMLLVSNDRVDFKKLMERLFAAGGTLELETRPRTAAFTLTAPSDAFWPLAKDLATALLGAKVTAKGFEEAIARTTQDEARVGNASIVSVLPSAVFDDYHYKNPPHGDPDTLESIGGSDIKGQLERFSPANAVVSVVGAFPKAAAKKLLTRFKGGRAFPGERPEVVLPSRYTVSNWYEMHIVGYPVTFRNRREVAAARLLQNVLYERVQRSFREAGFSYSTFVSVEREPWLDFELIAIPVHPRESINAERHLRTVLNELAKGVLTPGELDRNRRYTIAELTRLDRDPPALAKDLARGADMGFWYGQKTVDELNRLDVTSVGELMRTWFAADRVMHVHFSREAKMQELQDEWRRRMNRASRRNNTYDTSRRGTSRRSTTRRTTRSTRRSRR